MNRRPPISKPARPSQSLIGKTVSGIISRPAPGGAETLLVLQFTDGTCFEFLSPAAQRGLRRMAQAPADAGPGADQMTFFPQDGAPGMTTSARAC